MAPSRSRNLPTFSREILTLSPTPSLGRIPLRCISVVQVALHTKIASLNNPLNLTQRPRATAWRLDGKRVQLSHHCPARQTLCN
jgi:hypothetical protein